jgi:hypothetical protein
MFCPRCGAENEDANRFCVNCGSELTKADAAPDFPTSTKDRLGRLIGTDRKARLITAGTAVAIAIAMIAFFALDTDSDETSASPYLESIDQTCVEEKERISALEGEVLNRQPPDPREFASVLVTALAEWRLNLRETPPPPQDLARVEGLETALGATLVEAARLSRLIREEGSAGAIDHQAQATDQATLEFNEAIDGSGLSTCAEIQVSPVAAAQP